jgi:sugar (pentulose or hexulose) kinase
VVRDRTFQPEPARFPRYERLYEVFKQIHDRLQEPFERLALIP